jgi:uncharacterized protein YlxW (UPF0749 family)
MADSNGTRGRVAEPATLPDRVTMPLLELVTREALDEDYVQAARRRAAQGRPPGPQRTSQRGAAVVVAVFGLLIALAAIQTARNSDIHRASLDALTDRIDERKDEVAGLEDRVDSLQQQNADLEASGSRLGSQLAAATVELGTLQLSTGFVRVSGPGLRFTVSDSADGSPDGRVRATDLRRLVNGLWKAGAEAIALNGRRLSAISAIVQANIAVQVNRGPLSPPYVVSAIGDGGLGSRFDASTSGQQFQALAEQFGFQVDRQNETELLLPAAPDAQLRLRYAERPSGPRDNQEDAP